MLLCAAFWAVFARIYRRIAISLSEMIVGRTSSC
jgi:hypothetical protein